MCRVGLKVMLSFSAIIISNIPTNHGKALKCPQADMLNIAFQSLPYALARLKISHRATTATKAIIAPEKKDNSTTLQDAHTHEHRVITSTETTLIKEQIHKIFEPIKEFFSEIRRCSFLITPLIEKSLPEKIAKKSYLLKFMNTTTGLIEFFETEATSKQKLNEICEELDIFFSDLEDSLSPETQKAYGKFIQEIKSAKKSAHTDEKIALRFFDFEHQKSLIDTEEIHQELDTSVVPTA